MAKVSFGRFAVSSDQLSASWKGTDHVLAITRVPACGETALAKEKREGGKVKGDR